MLRQHTKSLAVLHLSESDMLEKARLLKNNIIQSTLLLCMDLHHFKWLSLTRVSKEDC